MGNSIQNKILYVEDFSIFDSAKFESQMKLVKEKNLFVTQQNFLSEIKNYIEREIVKYRYLVQSDFTVSNYIKTIANGLSLSVGRLFKLSPASFIATGIFGYCRAFTDSQRYSYGYAKGAINMLKTLRSVAASTSFIHSTQLSKKYADQVENYETSVKRLPLELGITFGITAVTSLIVDNVLNARSNCGNVLANLTESLKIINKYQQDFANPTVTPQTTYYYNSVGQPLTVI